MQIANPIYDVVFKYLMDDEKVARLMLSALLEADIEAVEYQATEHRAEMLGGQVSFEGRDEGRIPTDFIKVLRLDFQARIRLADGTSKLVLIEIQKARAPWDIQRFRQYLGSQYANPANHYVDVAGKKQPLPIITIYFLGEGLEFTDASVVRVDQQYRDGITGELIAQKERFIEGLTHASVVVQIPRLKSRRRNELEKLLSIFDQSRIQANPQLFEMSEDELPERYRDVVRRLQRAIAEPEVRSTMQIEDEIFKAFEEKDRELERKTEALEAQAKVVEAQAKVVEAQSRELEEKAKAIEEQAKLIKELQQKLQER